MLFFVFKVYPTLSEKLQKEWDEAEQARYEDLITEQVKSDEIQTFSPLKLHFKLLAYHFYSTFISFGL